MEEIREAMKSGIQQDIKDEMGDLLFVAANLARQLDVDPAAALRHANHKFETRFRAMEKKAGGAVGLQQLDLQQMEDLWQQVKSEIKAESGDGK